MLLMIDEDSRRHHHRHLDGAVTSAPPRGTRRDFTTVRRAAEAHASIGAQRRAVACAAPTWHATA
eukprot:6180971-Pleurochrysis_carterae.AAC.1